MGYRTIARVIGIIDMILSILLALLVTIMLFLLAYASAETSDLEASDTKEVVGVMLVLAWFFMILTALVCFLQIYAAWKLIEGTDQFVSAPNGLRACRIWRGITIFFLIFHILTMINRIGGGNDILQGFAALLFLLLRIVALGYVQQHMNQLHQTLPTVPTNTATSGTDTRYTFGVSAPPAYANTVHVPVSKY